MIILSAATGSRAQNSPFPLPANAKCAVPGDALWTQQEKFVWRQICAGRDADFNTEPGYGGKLDAKTDTLPLNRILRASFVETILFHNKYRSALTRRGVTIIGARFAQVVDLEAAQLQHPLSFVNCLFEGGINFTDLRSSRDIQFSDSRIARALDLRSLRVDGHLLIFGGELDEVIVSEAEIRALILKDSKISGSLNLAATRVASFADLTGLKVVGATNMYGLRIGATLGMGDKSEFNGVDLRRSHIALSIDLRGVKVAEHLDMSGLRAESNLYLENAKLGDLNLDGAETRDLNLDEIDVTGTLDMNAARVGGTLFMRNAKLSNVHLTGANVGRLMLDGVKITGDTNMSGIRIETSLFIRQNAELNEVNLTGAYIGGNTELDGIKLTTLEMNGLNAKAFVFLRDNAEVVDVDLGSAQIGQQLDLSDARVKRKLSMNGVRIGHSLVARQIEVGDSVEPGGVLAAGAHIGGPVDFGGGNIHGKMDWYLSEVAGDVSLHAAAFSGPIDFSQSKLKGNVLLTRAQFSGSVDLSGAQIEGSLEVGSGEDSAKWSEDAVLTLSNARVDVVPSLDDAWAPKLDLNGFSYRRVIDASAFEDWFERLDPYAFQPYSQLASVVQNQGNNELALEIRYSGKEREREQSEKFAWIWLTILAYSIGYGYHLEYALIWVAVLVLIGTALLRFSEQSWRNGLPSWLDKATYSFDMLLPIIRLRDKHYQIDLRGSIAYYFYFHKIMGYVLASFLIAGLSGLTK